MNICIGGDLDGRVIVLDKPSFNAKELNKTKSTNYIKQMYVIDGDVYYLNRTGFVGDFLFKLGHLT